MDRTTVTGLLYVPMEYGVCAAESMCACVYVHIGACTRKTENLETWILLWYLSLRNDEILEEIISPV